MCTVIPILVQQEWQKREQSTGSTEVMKPRGCKDRRSGPTQPDEEASGLATSRLDVSKGVSECVRRKHKLCIVERGPRLPQASECA